MYTCTCSHSYFLKMSIIQLKTILTLRTPRGIQGYQIHRHRYRRHTTSIQNAKKSFTRKAAFKRRKRTRSMVLRQDAHNPARSSQTRSRKRPRLCRDLQRYSAQQTNSKAPASLLNDTWWPRSAWTTRYKIQCALPRHRRRSGFTFQSATVKYWFMKVNLGMPIVHHYKDIPTDKESSKSCL